jgi:hypothetical protein
MKDLDVSELATRLQNGEVPTAITRDPLAPGDVCHFVAPVRFGRRRPDKYGHLVLTAGWLKFRGAQDMTVAWDEVAEARLAGREIVISLDASGRLLRFACHSEAEAARGGLIAQHLARSARLRTLGIHAGQHVST